MITPKTLVGFFLFRRQSILEIAGSRSARWLGFLFVLSAGFAREYDGEYLIAEPWHLLLPLAASIVGCSALMLLVRILSWCRQVRDVNTIAMFGALSTVYWMMAPLAWLYAIPVERFMDPGSATSANLTLLGIVSVWRVSLMIRCISVMYGATIVSATMPVMLFCLAMGYAAAQLIPSPIFLIMGGVRLTESEDLILGTKLILLAMAVVTSPIWIIGYLMHCLATSIPWKWQVDSAGNQGEPVSRPVWMIATFSILVWIPFLPWTQSEQRLRWRAEKSLNAGKFDELCKLTRDHPEQSFPPHWDPPPRLGYGEDHPGLFQTAAGIHAFNPAKWFWKIYSDKIARSTETFHAFYFLIRGIDDQELTSFVDLVPELDDVELSVDSIQHLVDDQLNSKLLSEKRRELFTRLREALKLREQNLGIAPKNPSSTPIEESSAPEKK